MLRLDNISHILAWSGKECDSLGEAAPVELVELPRVGLTFYVNEMVKNIIVLNILGCMCIPGTKTYIR